jgi:hypothetical protein
MAAKLEIEKRGDEIKKKSSPLKLLSQSQPNFAEMILWWSPSKSMSGISDLRPRAGPSDTILEENHPMTISSIKVWFQLSNWFQTRRFLCEFPIGSYVKLSSAVGAILLFQNCV